jgi:hypothetical protein
MSAILHLPLTPLAALFGLLTLLSTPKPPPEALPPLTGIPVDLLEGEEAEEPATSVRAPPEPEPAVALQPPAEKPERHEPDEPKIRDAGADPGDAAADAADADTEGTDAGAADGGITDPVAASGAERVVDVNANVKIRIYTEKIRGHVLSVMVGRALASVPQWRDFFGPAALDPVRDVDRILIVGPQLRDSSEVAVVAKVNVEKDRLRAAIDGIVRSDPDGKWLDETKVPAATARVDRAMRYFILPSSKMVIVSPPSAADNAMKVGPRFTLKGSSGNEVATAEVATPWRAIRRTGIPIDVPKSIQWVRFKATPDSHGGLIVEFVAKDESAEKAAENAGPLERNLKASTVLDLGLFRHKFVERIVVSAHGDEIHGAALLTARQLGDALAFAMDALGARAPRPKLDASVPRAPAAEPSPPAPAGTDSPLPRGREPSTAPGP